MGLTLPDSQDSHPVQALRFQDQAISHTLTERRGYLLRTFTDAQLDQNPSNSPTFNSTTMYPHRSRSDFTSEGILPGINVDTTKGKGQGNRYSGRFSTMGSNDFPLERKRPSKGYHGISGEECSV